MLADAWVSRAAAKQRRGRAGRTAPGACFALFSRKTAANLAPQQLPEAGGLMSTSTRPALRLLLVYRAST